jgi:glutamine amidotransferase
MVAIIDYQAGNIGSIVNMLQRLGFPSTVTDQPAVLEEATHIILPGVGSFDYGMSKLAELNLIKILNKKVLEEHVPILGVCLGAQLMCRSSEEGKLQGLGWIDAEVKKIPSVKEGKKILVPHIGWDAVTNVKSSKLFNGMVRSRFYFVHSFYIHAHHPSDVLSSNHYATEFTSAFEKGNILGVQFHPEKSHSYGKNIYTNFLTQYI